uniref:Uncharacterized protein n=1 Tax=Glossina brevipalpis TaxID=37001 RepID=A0A1A9WL57_9MUSC
MKLSNLVKQITENLGGRESKEKSTLIYVLSHAGKKACDKTQLQIEIDAINQKLEFFEQQIIGTMERIRNVCNKVQDWSIRSQTYIIDLVFTMRKPQVKTITQELNETMVIPAAGVFVPEGMKMKISYASPVSYTL